MHTRVALPALAATLLSACVPASADDDGRRDAGDDAGDDDVVVDRGPCPAPPVGVTQEETAPFLPGDDPTAIDDGGDGVVVLMGGGVEVDRAAARFVDGARGGEVLVLRASGSTSSYTGYFSDELAALVTQPARAVATVRIDDAALGADESVLCRVRRAEALWFAGGDQGDYLVRWPSTLHKAIAARIAAGVAVGGTSAGAMSLSAVAFDARDGGVTSDEALADPTAPSISVTPSPFPAVADVVVDTHFSARDREGRLLVFMARAGSGEDVRGVGLDEETALVIDGDTAQVRADDGGSAFVYEAEGASVTAGLDMERLVRRRLDDGATVAWPVPLDGGDVFRVDDGVLVPQP
jgi:cyanophycinase